MNCQDKAKFPKGIQWQKQPTVKNYQPNKGTIKFYVCKNTGAKYNATAKPHEKFDSSY